jgi:hypothetical protein
VLYVINSIKSVKSHSEKSCIRAALAAFLFLVIIFFFSRSAFAKDKSEDKLSDVKVNLGVDDSTKQNTLHTESVLDVGKKASGPWDHISVLGCSDKPDFSNVKVLDESFFQIDCTPADWQEKDIIILKSANDVVGGVFQVKAIEAVPNTKPDTKLIPGGEHRTSRLKLIAVRTDRFIVPTDHFERLEVSSDDEHDLEGTSYLWKTRTLPPDTKIIYRPLVTQGSTIGDTAQTLWKNEFFLSALGNFGYGISDTLDIGTNIAAFALGSPNGKVKGQVFRNENQIWSVSLNAAQERSSSEKLFNVDLMWDSILTDKLIAHSLISAAVISFNSAKDIAALKSYGNSSIQTGYEYLLNDWSRFLMGPSYNLDQKAIGGYLGYVKVIHNLHLQASLTTNNVRDLKFSAKEGYFFILDAYWRW